MDLIFKILMYGTIFIIGVMLLRVFRGPSVFDRLNGMFVIGLDVIVVLLLVGYTDGRRRCISTSRSLMAFWVLSLPLLLLSSWEGKKNMMIREVITAILLILGFIF